MDFRLDADATAVARVAWKWGGLAEVHRSGEASFAAADVQGW